MIYFDWSNFNKKLVKVRLELNELTFVFPMARRQLVPRNLSDIFV